MLVLLLFSSPHSFSTGFRSEYSNGHSRSLVLCLTHFLLFSRFFVWIIVQLEDPNTAHIRFLTESVNYWFYLFVFNRIHDSMCLNKMSSTSIRNIGPHTTPKMQQHILLYTQGTFYPCVHQTHLECLLLKTYFFFHLTIEASPIWSSSRVW